jgi:hypothetical protein
MPSTPVMLVNKGDYYGVPATAHLEKIPDITPPLLLAHHPALAAALLGQPHSILFKLFRVLFPAFHSIPN